MSKTIHTITLGRRGFLQGAAAAGLAAGTMPLANALYAQSGSVLRAFSYADIDKLDPGFYQNGYNVDVMNCIYSKLARYKPGREWEIELEAAEELEQIDDTHIRFKLKPGIMFSGGYGEMTAEDVKFSFERVLEHDSPVKGDWGPLQSVELDADDKYAGTIVLEKPFQPLWTITIPYGVGHIVSKKAVIEATGDGSDFGMEPPAFSGPYILEEWKPNQYVKMVRNPDYSGDLKPGYDEIRIIPMDDEKVAERAYEAGDLDYTALTLSSLANYKANPPKDTTIEEYPSLYYVWVGMNLENDVLKDENLRKAIQYAINVPQIMDAAYFGEAAPSTGLIAPGLTGHREQSIVPPEGNLDKAREYLEKAGGAPSQPITIDTLNATTWKTIAEVIQAQLGQIGIQVQVNVQDSGSFWTLGMESEGDRWKDMQLVINRFSMMPDPFYATSWFTTEQVGIWNWERFSNPEFDKLHEAALSEQDTAKRAEMYRQMQDMMEESGAYRFLTHEGSPVMFRDDVEPALRPDARPLYLGFKPA
ncbi:ABC transporter substrate-binding protein [Roseovarius sp. S4756]|uniref:ABC transporter substrate-binding protein n=1 Tax=Roseovarius maritimus TaxID=3342637 RepID=UPI00372CBF1E